ncbi:MAG: AraC family transcriptional regulator [Candidatus Pacebacteria bacterium]|nr:AraC family transcriptional regulator [Candidatus Paceibacterota bacterium]
MMNAGRCCLPASVESLRRVADEAVASRKHCRLVNMRLDAARKLMPPLNLAGVSLLTSHLHIGSGEYQAGRRVDHHQHRELQVEYVLRGSVRFSGPESQVTALTPGSGVMIGPETRHAWECESPAIMLGGLVSLIGKQKALFKHHVNSALDNSMHRLTADDSVIMLCNVFALATSNTDTAWREHRIAGLLYAWLANWLDMAIPLDAWIQHGGSRTRKERSGSEQACRRALQFIEDNYDRQIQLEDVAIQAGCSTRQLSRILRNERRSCFSHILREYRLRYAREMLEENATMPVKEVAYACGFMQPAYFSACFKQQFGIRPCDVG